MNSVRLVLVNGKDECLNFVASSEIHASRGRSKAPTTAVQSNMGSIKIFRRIRCIRIRSLIGTPVLIDNIPQRLVGYTAFVV